MHEIVKPLCPINLEIDIEDAKDATRDQFLAVTSLHLKGCLTTEPHESISKNLSHLHNLDSLTVETADFLKYIPRQKNLLGVEIFAQSDHDTDHK